MRKLTVRNFSVIKEAELEFGKITVLIGPQSSGKSLLCKLAYFLGYEVINIAIGRVVQRFEYGYVDFESAVQQEFSRWFPRGGWGSENWSIVFLANDYEVTVSAPLDLDPSADVVVTFNRAFTSAYNGRLSATLEMQRKREFLIVQALSSVAATEFRKLAGRGVWDVSPYIPETRSYFVDTMKGYKILATEPDPIVSEFAKVFANSMNPMSPKLRVSKYLKGELISLPDGLSFAFHDGRLLPLHHLSSGSKETLPILTVLDYYENQRRTSGNLQEEELYENKLYFFDEFTIEEPEASVFPQTQYELVRELAALANEVDFQPHFTVTTHSPYILTAFNNLIEAGQTARTKPDLRDDVAKLIPERYWIKEGAFRAYAIEDGVLKSIVAEDTGLISANYLDEVSETIGAEFDELLRLGYVES